MQDIQLKASVVIADVLGGRNLTDRLSELWRESHNLEPRQRAAIQDIAYGTLRRLGALEFMLDRLLLRPTSDPLLRCLLLAGLYQLAWGRSAHYAIVDHTVAVAGQISAGRAKGLVNAVLRNFLRQRDALLADCAQDLRAHWNHPLWWINALQRHYPEDWQRILEQNNQHPPMALRVNRRKTSVQAYLDRLQEAGLSGVACGESGIRLAEPVGVDRLPGFQEGLCSVQDPGAQRAAEWLDVQEGMRVLDACAAPGGKTGHLTELADLQLTALDNVPTRLNRVASNLARLGTQATLLAADAAKPESWWNQQPFDRILADVPCSASGVARRHPDIKWLRRETDLPAFAAQQQRMLEALWGCLAPGGKLLYVTCSVFPEENRLQAQAFLARQRNARLLPLSLSAATAPLPGDAASGLQLLPDDTHDGFFYALFAKD